MNQKNKNLDNLKRILLCFVEFYKTAFPTKFKKV